MPAFLFVNTPTFVTSLPVPAVVGTQISMVLRSEKVLVPPL